MHLVLKGASARLFQFRFRSTGVVVDSKGFTCLLVLIALVVAVAAAVASISLFAF